MFFSDTEGRPAKLRDNNVVFPVSVVLFTGTGRSWFPDGGNR